MMTLVCVNCGRKLKTKKIGAVAEEYIDITMTQGYRLFKADIKECESCNVEILWLAEGCYKGNHEEDYLKEIQKVATETHGAEPIKFY